MMGFVKIGRLKVDHVFCDFIEKEVLPGTNVSPNAFWEGVQQLIFDFAPENERLLEKRELLQSKLNKWNKEREGTEELVEYQRYLEEIGYLEEKVDDFEIQTDGIDDELKVQAGPQLVVPVNNARYALNAANARWGSLYDALYGTDVIDEDDGAIRTSDKYNPIRGEKVVTKAKEYLDEFVPLKSSSHKHVLKYVIEGEDLKVMLRNGRKDVLRDRQQFKGYRGIMVEPTNILFSNHGLHIEIQIDRHNPVGAADGAGVKDVVVEAALTTIMDFEDSVAAVDTEDKVHVYRNLLGLMKGTLSASLHKGKEKITRTLNDNKEFISKEGDLLTLPGRSLMLVRNVGHLMKTEMVLDENGSPVPEGIIDTIVTGVIAMHDLTGNSLYKNSRQGSVYIVKPKMHGSEEVAFANKLFNKVEDLLQVQRHTLKIGVMDEERRTSLNLKQCIREVQDRIFFINTGFLDRTGDEIHSSFYAGPMIRKKDMKKATWLHAYEKSNVQVGLSVRLDKQGQIGKGMWPMPDEMQAMVEQKEEHLIAGGNTSWVPSPTAATLHALHYHKIKVDSIQENLRKGFTNLTGNLLRVPIQHKVNWSKIEIQEELENNAQSILGYVVRWVEHGVGCSKVPDIHHVGLMEDRATLRISSQHMSNWLYHGICTVDEVIETMKKMACVVDEQNAEDPAYTPMSDDYDKSVAFHAALQLVLEGENQPNGYTEPILHRKRKEYKESLGKQVYQ
ncbi:malate synthase G [Bacillus shivajii]|uniref:malate synthase G n=1 Tax=Bacillus shivajii TaxID=1983719 RepID=UPI001CFA4652|nr:malate synthase G [Bacillus shivajii]UCZ53156.1 malate synthase G [Bacillus shivajii]